MIEALISDVREYQLLLDIRIGCYTSQELVEAVLEKNDSMQAKVRLRQNIIFLISLVLFLKWTYRANYNVRQLGATDMRFTPGWSIGWYFIPIANFWKPYQALKEIWKASSDPQNWKVQRVSPKLPWLWFLHVVAIVFKSHHYLLIRQAKEINEFLTANAGSQLYDIIMILKSIILIGIVNKVYEMQMAHIYAYAEKDI